MAGLAFMLAGLACVARQRRGRVLGWLKAEWADVDPNGFFIPAGDKYAAKS
jgi:hypothetical protein